MPYAYIIKSEEKKYYVGSCMDLETRIKRHNAHTGGRTTKGHVWQLIYNEEFEDIQKARIMEKKIKSYKGGNAFKKLIL